MNKYNYTIARSRIGSVILLVSILLTNCKAAVEKIGFVDLLDRYPKSLCVSIACFSGVTAGLTVRSVKKINRLPRLGRAGAIFLSSATAWLYTYDHNAISISQRIKNRQRNAAGTCRRTDIIGGLTCTGMFLSCIFCPPAGLAVLAIGGVSMVASEEARENGR